MPDTTLEINGTPESTFIAGSTIDVQLTDGVSTVTPTSIGVLGNTVTVEVPSGTSRTTAKLMKTGQTTSYRTGDDGDIEAGRDVSFTVLAENNPFGNTNRFTDELGTQTYTNNIIIDWSTYDGSTVLGIYRVTSGTLSWDDAIDQALSFSISSFTSGWRLPNIKEISNFSNIELSQSLNYSPINIGNVSLWSSSTFKFSTTQAWTFNGSNGSMPAVTKTSTSTNRRVQVRTFTVTGTILT